MLAAGDVATAAAWNVLVNNDIFFRVPPAVRCTKTASTSITSNTAITWDLESFDTDTMHSTSTNTSRITINTTGIYCITFGYIVAFSGTTTVQESVIRKNGSDMQYTQKYGSATGTIADTITTVLSLTATDYLECAVKVTGGTSLTTGNNPDSTFFSAFFVGATS